MPLDVARGPGSRTLSRGRADSPLSWSPRQPLLPTLNPVVESAIFHGLPGGAPPPHEEAPWTEAVDELIAHRLGGVALAAAEAHAVQLPPAVGQRLRAGQLAAAVHTMAMEAASARAILALTDAGIPTVVSKGPGIAALCPVPGERTYQDIDVLVAPGDFPRAERLLRDAGFDESVRMQPREWFHRRCREAINLVHDDGAALDLHHTVPPWYWGQRIDFASILAHASEQRLGGAKAHIADPVHNLLVSALHVVSDHGRPGHSLRVWRDVAVLANHCDPNEAAAEARRVRLDWWLAFILRELPEAVQPRPLLEALAGAKPQAADRFRLWHLLPPAVGSRHQVGVVFRLPVPNGIAFLAGTAYPSRDAIALRLGRPASAPQWWGLAAQRFVTSAREGAGGHR